MSYTFTLAELSNIPEIYEIIKKRVSWMNSKGIKQWNITDYLNVYPISYFEDHQLNGRLYKMFDQNSTKILGVMVLLDHDSRWNNYEASGSYFVHNFATEPTAKGIGSLMLEAAEKLSKSKQKLYLRLDCPKHNTFLNQYYESRGYTKMGNCVDGAYIGTLREKKL